MYTNTDITIYNKYLDSNTRLEKWQRTVFKGVFWDDKKGYNRLQSSIESVDEVFIVIPFNVGVDKEYVPPIEFRKLEDRANYFTIAEGDRVVKGDIDLEIEEVQSELDKEYEAFTITSVDTKDFGSKHMRHWEVGGK